MFKIIRRVFVKTYSTCLTPFFLLFLHLRFRKKPKELTNLIHMLTHASDLGARNEISQEIAALLYRDFNLPKNEGVFDDAAVYYIQRSAPWITLRYYVDQRVAILGTVDGELFIHEHHVLRYELRETRNDIQSERLTRHCKVLEQKIHQLERDNKGLMMLLIYFIVLSIRNRQ